MFQNFLAICIATLISIVAMRLPVGMHAILVQAQASSPPWLEWKISVGNIVTTLVVLVGLVPVARMCRAVQKSVSIFLDEHDVLWEDYNIRHGLDWRRTLGRTPRASTTTRGNFPDDPQTAKTRAAAAGRPQ